MDIEEAKNRLDQIIRKTRIQFYKPIQIAEVLHRARVHRDIDITNKDSFRLDSLRWRDEVTRKLVGSISESSARFQHDIWSETAMPPNILNVLHLENVETRGAVERYIYCSFDEKRSKVSKVMKIINESRPTNFNLKTILDLFEKDPGIKRSIDKAYEIIAYSLFETIVVGLKATITVSIPKESTYMLEEFSDLAKVLLGIDRHNLQFTDPAHIYRVGVTNAADRGLDMWANFGPAIQVKHLTLNEKLAKSIVDQIESNSIVIVCKTKHEKVIKCILSQITWSKKVRGIITEQNLIDWYEKCLRGKFSDTFGDLLLKYLRNGFNDEFKHTSESPRFFQERGYDELQIPQRWKTNNEI